MGGLPGKCLLNEQMSYFTEHLLYGRRCSRCWDMLMKMTGKQPLLKLCTLVGKQIIWKEAYFSQDQYETQNGSVDRDETVEG